MDVRTYRGANIDSDHFLVGTRIRARISNAKKERSTKTTRLNIELLKNPQTVERFQNYIETNCIINENLTISEQWEMCKNNIKDAANNILGPEKSPSRNDWFDAECEDITRRKNDAYKQMQQRKTREKQQKYKDLRREEKCIHRRKRKIYEKRILEELEALK
uniref:Uncharacterized protein LOC114336972 n=1 Tax=Diabrotica virgifera virgifera TaxID=50390 RepID=A0A6P7G883_DIAVI